MKLIVNNTQEASRIARMANAAVPKEVREKLDGIDAFLCGGTFVSLILGDKIRDLDFFFSSKEEYEKAKARIVDPLSLDNVLVTFNAVNFKVGDMKIQFINKLFLPTIEETLGIFDIRAAMCGMTVKQIQDMSGFWSHEDALYDIAKKMLVIMTNHRNPHNVTMRIAKYVKRGWDIKGQSFVRLILQQLIRAKDIKTLSDVRDEILGMDTMILTEFFKSYDKFPPEAPLEELQLREMMTDVDDYFQGWAENSKEKITQ